MSAKPNSNKGKRYSAAEKKKILAYVDEVDAAKGRGGQAAAAKKYGISHITISGWKKAQREAGEAGEAAEASAADAAPAAAPASKKVGAKKAGAKKSKTVKRVVRRVAAPTPSATSSTVSKLNELKEIAGQISAATSSLAALIDRFESLKNTL